MNDLEAAESPGGVVRETSADARSRSVRLRAAPSRTRIDAGEMAVSVLSALLVVYLALENGGYEAITRSEDGPGRLNPARLLSRLRTDDEIANAILMNRHWTALRKDITERRIASNRTLAEALRAELANGS